MCGVAGSMVLLIAFRVVQGLVLLRRVVAFEAFESFAVVGVSGLVLASSAER